jgi:hypothetical protein
MRDALSRVVLDLDYPELLSLFLLLREREEFLDGPLLALLSRIERVLYGNLTVEEIEAMMNSPARGPG